MRGLFFGFRNQVIGRLLNPVVGKLIIQGGGVNLLKLRLIRDQQFLKDGQRKHLIHGERVLLGNHGQIREGKAIP